MAIPRVIHGLAKKRAQLVAELSHPQGRHEYCRQGIAAIDAVLPLWDVPAPVYVRRYKAKPTILPHLVRKIVTALREAPEPLLTRQIVDVVSAGLNLDAKRRLELTRLVIQRLRDMRTDGRVMHAGSVGRRRLWELAETKPGFTRFDQCTRSNFTMR
jgi:hypothetical protein